MCFTVLVLLFCLFWWRFCRFSSRSAPLFFFFFLYFIRFLSSRRLSHVRRAYRFSPSILLFSQPSHHTTCRSDILFNVYALHYNSNDSCNKRSEKKNTSRNRQRHIESLRIGKKDETNGKTDRKREKKSTDTEQMTSGKNGRNNTKKNLSTIIQPTNGKLCLYKDVFQRSSPNDI